MLSENDLSTTKGEWTDGRIYRDVSISGCNNFAEHRQYIVLVVQVGRIRSRSNQEEMILMA